MTNKKVRISYSEFKVGTLSSFRKIVTDEVTGEVILDKIVSCPIVRVNEDGFEYIVLYTNNMEPIQDAFEYLNYDLRYSPATSRNKAAYALRLLYCFLELSAYSVRQIDHSTLRKLQYFLLGLGLNDAGAMGNIRSTSTVNGYFSVYRSFFGKRGIPCDALFQSKSVTVSYVSDDVVNSEEFKRYTNNLKESSPLAHTVPKYISPDDFRILYRLAVETNDEEAQILFQLMYIYGLRLGEALGITTEDITEVRDNGRYLPVIFLRNRITDKNYQFCKGLMHPSIPEQYRSTDYNKSRHRIVITYDFYEKLVEYIERTHADAMENYPENYAQGVADIVSYRDTPDTNHYVFLNRYGRVLSDQTWNNKLKKYFQMARIPMDAEIRENNLSHRFRHGFAMFHARFSRNPVSALELQKMLRHRSVSSTMVYYNPTPEDELKIKTEFLNELYDMMPELKGGWYDGDKTLYD